ncbi:MAG: Hemolysin-type calcium-binding protein [Ilumatobacteraceae bacterium]|nr:Hemolysin-type calcium-binding protein [Ilumatobacteraceae bacterium]
MLVRLCAPRRPHRAASRGASADALIVGGDPSRVYGGEGSDTFSNGPLKSYFNGGPGANTFNGGPAQDTVATTSDADVIHVGGGLNHIYDQDSLRSGGRTVDATSSSNGYFWTLGGSDVVFRMRPSTLPGQLLSGTASLHRPGRQTIPSTGFNSFAVDLSGDATTDDRGLADIVIPANPTAVAINVSGDSFDNDLGDLTVPTGTWITTGTTATALTVTTSDPNLANPNSLQNGKSLRQFRAQLFGSNEYFTKAGGTNARFVVKAYEDVLGRAPDAAGQTYWTNKIDDGTERGLVARQFLSSPEARRSIVKDQFLRFLDRYPTPAETDTWVAALGSSSSGEQDLIAFLGASSAYFARS